MAVRDDLIREEAVVPYVYKDSKGIWTCGVGFNVDKDHGGNIPQEVINYWLDFNIRDVQDKIDSAIPWWRSKSISTQDALTEIAYQMGVGGLLKFKDTLTAIQNNDYDAARLAAADSDWARTDSPARAKRVIAKIGA